MSAPETVLILSAVEWGQGVSGVHASSNPSGDMCEGSASTQCRHNNSWDHNCLSYLIQNFLWGRIFCCSGSRGKRKSNHVSWISAGLNIFLILWNSQRCTTPVKFKNRNTTGAIYCLSKAQDRSRLWTIFMRKGIYEIVYTHQHKAKWQNQIWTKYIHTWCRCLFLPGKTGFETPVAEAVVIHGWIQSPETASRWGFPRLASI